MGGWEGKIQGWFTIIIGELMRRRALIVFAKFPEPGNVKTRLGKSIGMEAAALVYRQLAAHAFSVAAECQSNGITVYVFYETGPDKEVVLQWIDAPLFILAEQHGATLGDRMRHAFNKTFDDGATETVIIGTDVPELDAYTVSAAFDAFLNFDIVVGPSTDGGYYLLGMKLPTKDIFDAIAWSTGSVIQQTLEKLDLLNLSVTLLKTLSDVDTETDYRAYLERR